MRTVINNGRVIDPVNGVDGNLNMAFENGRISDRSIEPLQGDLVIDASGLTVTPGFVDIHIHEDAYLPVQDQFQGSLFESLLRMGVTTAVGGNCGIGSDRPDVYLDAVDRIGLPVNTGLLVPHATLRKQVGLENPCQQATTGQIRVMASIADEWLSDGCLGVSFGIRYTPGINREELTAISCEIRKHRAFLAVHLREDAGGVIEAVEEVTRATSETGVPLQISHVGSMAGFGQMEEFLKLLELKRSAGRDISADCYPYDSFSTYIGAETFGEGFLERYQTGYASIEIAQGQHQGQRCTKELFEHLRSREPALLTIAHVMKPEEIEKAIAHPWVMVASDGLINGQQGHPRAAGTFPRVLGEYVRHRGLLPLPEAVAKMTAVPAKRLGVSKGKLGMGDDADITLFDPAIIMDQATFQSPLMPPVGIEGVFVNGRMALWKNQIMDTHAGRSLRNQRSTKQLWKG